MLPAFAKTLHSPSPSTQRLFCSTIHKPQTPDPILVRKFIADRLYHKTEGYFCKKDVQLGYLKEPIKFQQLFGFEEYNNTLKELYPENAWLTPSEIFKPYYGISIAKYINRIVDQANQKPSAAGAKPYKKVKIIEAGAGNGSAADSILDYFKMYHPKTYPFAPTKKIPDTKDLNIKLSKSAQR